MDSSIYQKNGDQIDQILSFNAYKSTGSPFRSPKI